MSGHFDRRMADLLALAVGWPPSGDDPFPRAKGVSYYPKPKPKDTEPMPRIAGGQSKFKDKADPRSTGDDRETLTPRPAWMDTPSLLPKRPPPLPAGRSGATRRGDHNP